MKQTLTNLVTNYNNWKIARKERILKARGLGRYLETVGSIVHNQNKDRNRIHWHPRPRKMTEFQKLVVDYMK